MELQAPIHLLHLIHPHVLEVETLIEAQMGELMTMLCYYGRFFAFALY